MPFSPLKSDSPSNSRSRRPFVTSPPIWLGIGLVILLLGINLLTNTLAQSKPNSPMARRQTKAHLRPDPPKLTPDQIVARNKARFPDEPWWPPGFDVEEEEPLGNSTIRTLWTSPKAIEMNCKSQKRIWPGHKPKPAQGTLMLNMLVYNEADNLRRTLPLWAKTIDYWIIGLDDKNDDDSIEVIKQYLGHLPGEISEVHFDGIGPTWSQVVRQGIRNFPGAQFGILADADHAPVEAPGFTSVLDRTQLDIDAVRMTFRSWSEDHHNAKITDWIYRNIPGARVHRRCHHYVEIPAVRPYSLTFYPAAQIDIDERAAAGIGVRMGSRDLRYIKWLTQDLDDYPNDSRSIYYRAHSHFNLVKDYQSQSNYNETDVAYHLQRAIDDFTERSLIEFFPQEAWMAHFLLFEIHLYHRVNETRVLEEVQAMARLDSARGEPIYILGRWYFYHMHNQAEGLKHMGRIVEKFRFEQRDFYQWPEMFKCARYVDYANMVLTASPTPDKRHITSAIDHIKKADCNSNQASSLEPRLKALLEQVQSDAARSKSTTESKPVKSTKKQSSTTRSDEDDEDDSAPRRRRRRSRNNRNRSRRRSRSRSRRSRKSQSRPRDRRRRNSSDSSDRKRRRDDNRHHDDDNDGNNDDDDAGERRSRSRSSKSKNKKKKKDDDKKRSNRDHDGDGKGNKMSSDLTRPPPPSLPTASEIDQRISTARSLYNAIRDQRSTIESKLSGRENKKDDSGDDGDDHGDHGDDSDSNSDNDHESILSLSASLKSLSSWLDRVASLSSVKLGEASRCVEYRRATLPIIKLMQSHADSVKSSLPSSVFDRVESARKLCR